MSTKNRNKATDIAATAAVVHASLGGQSPPPGQHSWLDHSAKAAALDRALILGATTDQLRKIRKSEVNHRYHLRVAHGITLENVGGLWRFSQ